MQPRRFGQRVRGVRGFRHGRLFVWTNAQGTTTFSGRVATKGAGDAWNAGGQANVRLTGNGFAEFIVTDTTSMQMVGLATVAATGNFTAINWAIYVSAGEIWESGSPVTVLAPPVLGDRIRIGVENGVVIYRHNGTAMYTSLVAPVGRLYAVAAQFAHGATITGVILQGVWT